MFVLTFAVALVVVPWYGFAHGYHTAAWVWFVLLLGANGMAITCGYHRLYAHATYDARASLKLVYLLLGAMALQNSALIWSAGHRTHHRHIDDIERDPYCARRGFWFSHIGWMLRVYPSSRPDLDCVPDLKRDTLVMWQHRHYLGLALSMNFGLPLLAACFSGEFVGMFLLAGVLRLVVSHHVTFFINSLAHMWGSQPYTDDNTARDNAVVALLTYGEGYHNFHHRFAHDYRNGVRWWQWDPSKWFINAMRWLSLASNLKRVPGFKIQRALLETQFRRADRELARDPAVAQIEQLRNRIAEEYASFCCAVASWARLRGRGPVQTDDLIPRSRLKQQEYRLRLQNRRVRMLRSQLGLRH
jgi:stearoyl-CoA desaturase (Delta-9 desaturase)